METMRKRNFTRNETIGRVVASLAAVVFLVVPAFAQQESGSRDRSSDPPGIYALFVWGTKATATEPLVSLCQRKMESAFVEDETAYARESENYDTAGSLAALAPYLRKTITLSGDDASPQGIVDACETLANAAGPNDAVLVYILCHGAAVVGSDGRMRHGFSPIALSAGELRMGEIGISRGTIMKTIKSRPHRLNLLISDACSVAASHKYVPSAKTSRLVPKALDLPYLGKFLLNARGELNINSSRPPKDFASSGEKARGYFATAWSAGVPENPDERDAYERFSGTVFLNAFLELATARDYDPEIDYDPQRFFEKLRARLDDKYWETWLYLKINNQMTIANEFMGQWTQTLTRFDDGSLPYAEDLQYKSRHKFEVPRSIAEGAGDDGTF
ncbi:MAG: hypothetical protein IJM30_08825 [Thermoguttaceae bacterium]|nr:hypothetical protein [Thermoguttaceae bacterium]